MRHCAKIIRVMSCISCPFMSVRGDELVCNSALGGRSAGPMAEMVSRDRIPDWCPLLDEDLFLHHS